MDSEARANLLFGDGVGEEFLRQAIKRQTLRYSNFLITFSTNLQPKDRQEQNAVVRWLERQVVTLFGQWDTFNGTVVKPAGSPNSPPQGFGSDHKIRSVRSRVGIEVGDFQRGKGQVHAHITLEIAHEYSDKSDGGMIGVHTNVGAMRAFLSSRIQSMDIDDDRKPKKIYVNSKLLTTGTDNSNKWLTYQYLEKQTAHGNDGTEIDLIQDRENADPELQHIREVVRTGGLVRGNNELEPEVGYAPANWRTDPNLGAGGALTDEIAPKKRVLRPKKY